MTCFNNPRRSTLIVISASALAVVYVIHQMSVTSVAYAPTDATKPADVHIPLNIRHIHNKSRISTSITRALNKTDINNKTKPANVTGKRLKVLLVTNYRSGSSFVGELLKNNPDVFYSFEPLYFVTSAGQPNRIVNTQKNVTYDNTASYLEDLLFRCEVKTLESASKIYLPNVKKRTAWIPRAFPGSRSFSMARDKCRVKKDIAVKVIRLPTLQEVVPRLIDQGAVVLYLVRDPRGIMSSRLKIHGGRSNPAAYLARPGTQARLSAEAAKLCKSLSTNAQYLRNHIHSGDFEWRKNVAVLRYEDVAYHPTDMASLLYKYLGIPLPQRVQAFIDRSTHASARARVNPYGVQRDSEKTAEAWRTYLPYSFVDILQNICNKTLLEYGYDFANNSTLKQLKQSLVLPFPKDIPQLV